MNTIIFQFLLASIPVIGLIITGHVIPYIKTKITAEELLVATEWVTKAVAAAEVLFKASGSGNEKREYVINFVNEKINKKKEVISKEQIRVLLEAAWKEMIGDKKELEENE